MQISLSSFMLLSLVAAAFAESVNEADITPTEDVNATDITYTKEWHDAFVPFFEAIQGYRALLKKGPIVLETPLAYEKFIQGLNYNDLETLNFVIDYYWLGKTAPQDMQELSWRQKHSKLRLYAGWKVIREIKPERWFNTTILP